MLIPESAYRSEEFPSPATTVVVAEITCIMCGRDVGTAVDTRWPPIGSVLIQLEGSTVLRRIQLDRLRCPDCGGNTEATDVSTKLLRRERPLDWQHMERPRPGRPPKWLLAQRAAAHTRDDRSA